MFHSKLRKKIIKTAYQYLSNKTEEHQIILFEKENDEIGLFDLTQNNTEYSVDYSMSVFLNIKEQLKGKFVYSAHNHPSGSVEPSMSDYFAFNEFSSLLRLNNINLLEEFIISGGHATSFKTPETDFTSSNFHQELLHDEPVEIDLTFYSKETDNSEKENVEKLFLEKLLLGYEVAMTENAIYYSQSFNFEDLMTISKDIDEVAIWGVPNYRDYVSFTKIKDINNVFGSIEFYSLNKEKLLIPLKQSMTL